MMITFVEESHFWEIHSHWAT